MRFEELQCVEENIWYGKKRKNKRRPFRSFIVIAILVFAFLYYSFIISEQIISVSKSSISSYISLSVNGAVIESLNKSVNYSDIVTVQKDVNGDIAFVTVDNVKTNLICKNLALNTQKKLSEYEEKGVSIPFGSLIGLSILSGFGRKINLKIMTTGNCTARFNSVFKSVGINQTLHAIYCIIDSSISLDIPLTSTVIGASSEVLLCESVLIGKVPDFYFT